MANLYRITFNQLYFLSNNVPSTFDLYAVFLVCLALESEMILPVVQGGEAEAHHIHLPSGRHALAQLETEVS